jgi:hypothetical protein
MIKKTYSISACLKFIFIFEFFTIILFSFVHYFTFFRLFKQIN